MTEIPEWVSELRLPDGHRIFETDDVQLTPRNHEQDILNWAIADNSGEFPHETDDGIMWLDRERALRADAGMLPAIPVIDNDGNENWVISNAAALLFLGRKFDWTVSDRASGYFYIVH
jgi:hypothetical protein